MCINQMDPLRASWSIYWLYDCKLNRGIIIRLFSHAMKHLIILALLRYVVGMIIALYINPFIQGHVSVISVCVCVWSVILIAPALSH